MSLPKGTIGSIGVGVCASHPVPIPVVVTWPAGTPTTLSNGMMNLNQASQGVCSCGHQATPLMFSMTVMDEKMGCHRMGDVGATGSGTYVVMNGAATVLAGG